MDGIVEVTQVGFREQGLRRLRVPGVAIGPECHQLIDVRRNIIAQNVAGRIIEAARELGIRVDPDRAREAPVKHPAADKDPSSQQQRIEPRRARNGEYQRRAFDEFTAADTAEDESRIVIALLQRPPPGFTECAKLVGVLLDPQQAIGG